MFFLFSACRVCYSGTWRKLSWLLVQHILHLLGIAMSLQTLVVGQVEYLANLKESLNAEQFAAHVQKHQAGRHTM